MVARHESTVGRRGTALSLLAILLPGAMLLGCDEPEPPAAAAPPPPKPVQIVQVQTRDVPLEFPFVGRTESSQRVEIRARVAGYLDDIAYTEGRFVEQGDVLFQIDPKPFESALRAARAELRQQQANLDNAQSLFDRIEPLAALEAVAEKELDDARGGVLTAKAAVEAAEAGVYDAELNLEYTTIRAPVRGLTSSSAEREGAYISGSTGPLTYVAKIDPMWVEFSIAETQILRSEEERAAGRVEPPKDDQFDVAIELSDGTEHPYTGRISFADASVSTETGSVLIRAEIPNPDETLRPGQYARILLRGAYRPDAVAVPQRAIRQGSKGAFVWVIDANSQAEQRPVTAGPWHGDDWIVETGLRPGDRVIVDGSVGLRPGMPVTVSGLVIPDRASGAAEGSAESGVGSSVEGGDR